MKQTCAFVLVIAFSISFSFSQQDWTWCFGASSYLHFPNGGTPVYDSTISPGIFHEAGSSISDANGDLLFYANDQNIYARDFSIMQNGAGINGNGSGVFTESTTNGVLILPAPGHPSEYYIFHIRPDSNHVVNLLYYHQVDITGNGGMGIVTAKNQALLPTLHFDEKLSATRHFNGRDWWILVHESRSHNFYTFLLDENGISAPFRQEFTGMLAASFYSATQGEMEFSRNGTQVAYATLRGNIFLFDFDRCSGLLSNFQDISGPGIGDNPTYGCAFSPLGRYLYTTALLPLPNPNGTVRLLHQFDLFSPDIRASKTEIFRNPQTTTSMGQLQSGPDGKIYLANIDGPLSVIHAPDNAGTACNFQFNYIRLPNRLNLPNHVNYNLGPVSPFQADAGPDDTICRGNQLTLGVPDVSNGQASYTWTPAHGLNNPTLANPVAQPDSTTWYYLTMVDNNFGAPCGETRDSVLITVLPDLDAPLADLAGPDQVICRGDSLQLGSPGLAGLTVTWTGAGFNSQASQPVVAPQQSQGYYLTVLDSSSGLGCEVHDTVTITVEQPFSHEVPASVRFCPGEVLTVGVPPQVGYTYAWHPATYLREHHQSATTAQPEETTSYTFTIVNEALTTHCREQNWPVVLSASDCLLPNVVTPNGDGINDELDFGTFAGPVQLNIFDRWGNQIYVDANYLNTWTGEGYPVGTYYFVLKITGEPTPEKAGHFALFR